MGYNLLSLAFPANSLTLAEISFNPFLLASNTIGVINPPSVETAIEISAFLYYLILSSSHLLRNHDFI